MYVVRRAFRSYGSMLVPGTVVEPNKVKRFKSHLNERDIIEVTNDTFDAWNEYFTRKFGTPIIRPADTPAEAPAEAPVEATKETVKPAAAKVVVKLT